MRTYIVIDVEMCKVQKSYAWKDYRYANEIIQVGAVMLNENYEQIGEFSSYVRPQYGKIDLFIENLTGIRRSDVRNAPTLGEVLRSMSLWIGNRDVTFYSWSDTDYFQIRGEILAKGYDETEMEKFLNESNWVDYQKALKERLDMSRVLSLSDALTIAELEAGKGLVFWKTIKRSFTCRLTIRPCIWRKRRTAMSSAAGSSKKKWQVCTCIRTDSICSSASTRLCRNGTES